MKLLRNRGVLAVAAVLLGVVLTLGVQRIISGAKIQVKTKEQEQEELFGDTPPPGEADPLASMQRMQERMHQQMMRQLGQFGAPAGGNSFQFSFGGANQAGDVKEREDDKFVYYDLAIDGLDKKNLNVKVADGQISISGKIEKKTGDSDEDVVFTSHFQRSFPVPPGVDSARVQLEQEKKGMLVIKFPKTHG